MRWRKNDCPDILQGAIPGKGVLTFPGYRQALCDSLINYLDCSSSPLTQIPDRQTNSSAALRTEAGDQFTYLLIRTLIIKPSKTKVARTEEPP
jgi:hypothetical protein